MLFFFLPLLDNLFLFPRIIYKVVPVFGGLGCVVTVERRAQLEYALRLCSFYYFFFLLAIPRLNVAL